MTPLPTLMAANRRSFHKLVAAAQRGKSPAKQAALCSQAAIFAVRNPCGIFSSWPLEECLLSLANTLSCPMAAEPESDTFLHVFSRAYSSGGHTRVAERWINASPATGTHDVVLLSQGDRPVPATLETATQSRKGRIHRLADGLHLDKARQLRSLASRYQHVILHVHMYDILPVLAFGTPAFTRPVTFYNHADHLFWVGVSVADRIVNLRSHAIPLNTDYRGIAPSLNSVLPLPLTPPRRLPSPEESLQEKHRLGLSPENQIILTMASPYKYAAIEGQDFIATAEDILEQNPKAVLLAIGPSRQEPAWQQAHARTGGRIRPLGRIPHTETGKILALADLALDSFPIASLMALLDIACHGVPCLTLQTPINGYDAYTKAGINCATPAELIQKASSILQNPPKTSKLLQILTSESLPEAFAIRLAALQANLPTSHTVHIFPTDEHPAPIPLELSVARNNLANARSLKGRLVQGLQTCITFGLTWASPRLIPQKVYRRLESFGAV